MPQTMQPQNTPGGDIKLSIGQPRPNNTDILSGLIAAVLAQGQNTNNQSMSQSSAGPQGQTGANQQGVDNAGSPNAYQQGVQSALKKLGQQHVAEASAAGVDPMSIANHPVTTGMANFGGNDPKEIIAQLLSSGQINGNTQSNPQPQPQQQSQPQKIPVQSQSAPQNQSNNQTTQPISFRPQGFFETNKNYGIALDNTIKQQQIKGQQPIQQSEIQKNLLPMTEYERAQTGISKASMLLNYGGKVSDDFQKTIQPHVDTVNDGLTANNLYANVLANPNNQQAQQAFLEASAKLQGVKDSRTLVQGRGALSASKGAISQFAGGGGYSQNELSRIQAANIAKYKTSQNAIESMTQQHQNRLKSLGLEPDQFINQYGSQKSNSITDGTTATNPQTGQKITFRGGKWQ